MTPKSEPRLVIGVDASGGEVEELRRLLSTLPSERGWTLLLIQPDHTAAKGSASEQLASCTKLSVQDASADVELAPNTVYASPSNLALAVRGGKVVLGPHKTQAPSGAELFRSLAAEYGSRAVAIVLSPADKRNEAGLAAVRAAAGLTLALTSASSPADNLPLVDVTTRSALAAAVIERFAQLAAVMPLDSGTDGPEASQESSAEPEAAEERRPLTTLSTADLTRLGGVLEAELNFDLRAYKPTTLVRRILRRMALSGCDAFDAYIDQLRQDPNQRRALVRDLLITVTDFFRDPESFRALRHLIIEPLVARSQPGATLRAWVPACASGEEAYSLAIEFLDAIEAHDKSISLQIFATDISHEALAMARAGVYPASLAERVSAQRLQAYFKALEGGYQVRSPLRDVVSFAAHDLTRDPPFSRMNLVSCRNVLIYLTAEAQKHVIKFLHFALEPQGYLLLSTSESVGQPRELFATVSKNHRIYQKLGPSQPITLLRSRHRPPLERELPAMGIQRPTPPRTSGTDLARRAVLEAVVPPTIVVSEDGILLFSHGELGPFLQIPQGDNPRLDVASVLRPEIATRTRGALYKCRRDRQPVTVLSSPDATRNTRLSITARPAPSLGEEVVIISFEEVEEQEVTEPPRRVERANHDGLLDQLEKELATTREDLRSTVEELESTNEQLRSSNEQSTSMNEELQSANEELEATTEELRSLNEELTTVNSQLREKVEQIEQAHDDLHNFFASTKMATVFLDDRLCIKRFTPAAVDLLGIEHSDTGRCIRDMAREMLQNELPREALNVLERFSTSSHELKTSDGRWIARRVLPYRTENRRVEGVVVTFADITEFKSTTEKLKLRERQQSVIARIGLQALREADLQTFMDQVVRDVQQALDTDYCKILELQPGGQKLLLRAGVGWRLGLVGSGYVSAELDSQAGYTLQSDEAVIVSDLPKERRFSGPPLLHEHGVISGLSSAIRNGDQYYGVIGAHTTDRRDFDREDASFLQAVASVVGSAVARYQTRLRLAVERGVAQSLAEATSLDDALIRVIECFATELPLSLGEAWLPREGGAALERRLRQPMTPGSAKRFSGPTFKAAQRRAEELAQRVFADGMASWATDLDAPLSEAEGASNEQKPLTGFGLPIRAGRERLGVLVFFSAERLFADDVFLPSIEGIGRSIGDFASRFEVEQRARRLAAITRSSHDAILCYDHQWQVTEWLPGAERLFGFTPGEMIGASLSRIVPEDRRDELRQINARIRQGEVVEAFETVRMRQDGSLIEVSVRISPVKNKEGEIIGISASDRDVTRLKETERRLVQADRQKDEFIAMLGHELRNPLAAIRSASALLTELDDDPSMLRRTQAILERQSTHMAKLLDGLLDISRIVRGKIELEKETIDLADICREVCADVKQRLAGRPLSLSAKLPSVPVWIEGDRLRLIQVLDNLLSNAVKFTGDGGAITLTLTVEEENAVLHVQDTGVGISQELLPNIFEVFRQADQTLERSSGGLGLGLALVKSLVELHGGHTTASSQGLGKGAEFVVHLPTTRSPDTVRSVRPPSAQGPLRILVIEDNEDSAEMLQQLLELSGHQVLVASRGQRGVELAAEHQPDLVLCDLGLPGGMTGFDVAKSLRADPKTRDLRLVALTGYGRPEDKDRCHQAGFDTHLTKPIDLKALGRILGDLNIQPTAP